MLNDMPDSPGLEQETRAYADGGKRFMGALALASLAVLVVAIMMLALGCGRPFLRCTDLQIGAAVDGGSADAGADR